MGSQNGLNHGPPAAPRRLRVVQRRHRSQKTIVDGAHAQAGAEPQRCLCRFLLFFKIGLIGFPQIWLDPRCRCWLDPRCPFWLDPRCLPKQTKSAFKNGNRLPVEILTKKIRPVPTSSFSRPAEGSGSEFETRLDVMDCSPFISACIAPDSARVCSSHAPPFSFQSMRCCPNTQCHSYMAAPAQNSLGG